MNYNSLYFESEPELLDNMSDEARRTASCDTERPMQSSGMRESSPNTWVPPADVANYRERVLQSIHDDRVDSMSLLDQLCRSVNDLSALPEAYFHVLTRLLDLGVSEAVARELIQEINKTATPSDSMVPERLWSLLGTHLQAAVRVTGPISIPQRGQKIVALVGPTGVGKTTTIAKLAGNLRLRERRRVGLVTVDTYRIAAVDQLKTYADIIDLPMEVVATPREMQEAIAHMSDQDIVFIDTAGRSPQNELQLRELKAMLAAAEPDEIQLVLSTVASAANLAKVSQRFRSVGVNALILTKIDETECLSELIPFFRQEHLPVSYVTNGQSVPDDIQVAQRKSLVRALLGES